MVMTVNLGESGFGRNATVGGLCVLRAIGGMMTQSSKFNKGIDPGVNPGVNRIHQLQDKEQNNHPNLVIPLLQKQDDGNTHQNADAPTIPERNRSGDRRLKPCSLEGSLEFSLFSDLRFQDGRIV